MLSRLKVKNFTVFRDAAFDFAPGVNVIIGENGAGKSHLMKLAYVAARWSAEMSAKAKQPESSPDKATLQRTLGEKLLNTFRSESVGRLVRRGVGNRKSDVEVAFSEQPKAGFKFEFSNKSVDQVTLAKSPAEFFSEGAVFFPTKEMLSMYPGFAALYRDYHIQIDETYYDLCLALDRPLLKGRRFDEVNKLLEPVEKALRGRIRNENGRFYLISDNGKIEIPLVAEGFRKLGTVAYLLANGTLKEQSILFWDEPETNLNPAYMAQVAELLVEIARGETQVFVATHSLYIMRELSMMLAKPENAAIKRRFMALTVPTGNEPEDGAVVKTGESAEDIEPIASLDAELRQSQRYIDQHS